MSVSANRRPAGPPASAAGRRNRRVLVIVGLAAVATIGAALAGWRFARESTPVTGPILLISIDPLRADRLSVYGGPLATPNLARLAADATVFTRASAHAAASLPAHTSLLTGQLPFDHGVRDDIGFTLDDDAETLASRLADRGFATGAAVSTYMLGPATGLDTGFAAYDGVGAGPSQAAPAAAAVPAPAADVARDSAATARVATSWLDAQDSARFFYTLQLNGVPVPEDGAAAATDTAIGAADAAVGTVLDTLRRKGWYDGALVVVTAANGGPPDGADPGREFTLAEPSRHVPLVVKMPGGDESQRVDVPLQHIDVAPTVLDLVRAPGSSSLRGRSFRGLLEGDDDGPAPRPAYAEAMSGALRFGWAELAEPGDETFRSSLDGVTPAPLDDREREAFARLGQVAPTLWPLATSGGALPADPRTMGTVVAAYRRAARHDAARAFAAAIAAYREVVAATPADANAWFRIGLAAGRLGRTDEMIAAFERVETLRPRRGDGALAAARLDADNGADEAAAARVTAWLDTADADTPPEARAAAHGLLADIAVRRARPADARAQAALAEKAAPRLAYLAFTEARLLQTAGRHVEAVAAFDEIVTTLGDAATPFDSLHRHRGESLDRLDRPAEAAAAFERAIADAPLDPRGYLALAALRATPASADAAGAVLDRLIAAVPTPPAYAAAARVAASLGVRERAAGLRAEARERFAGEPGLRLLAR